MANKPLGFPFGFFTNDNTPDSGKYWNRIETPPRPYTNIAEVMSVLPIGVRVGGLTVNVVGVEYWWKPEWNTNLLLAQNPVVKEYGISPGIKTTLPIPFTTINWQTDIVPTTSKTYAQQYGNFIKNIQGEFTLDSTTYNTFSPEVTFTKNSNNKILTMAITNIKNGEVTISGSPLVDCFVNVVQKPPLPI